MSSFQPRANKTGCMFCGFIHKTYGPVGRAIAAMAAHASKRDRKHEANKKLKQGKEK